MHSVLQQSNRRHFMYFVNFSSFRHYAETASLVQCPNRQLFIWSVRQKNLICADPKAVISSVNCSNNKFWCGDMWKLFTWKSLCPARACSSPADDDETDQVLGRVLCCHRCLSVWATQRHTDTHTDTDILADRHTDIHTHTQTHTDIHADLTHRQIWAAAWTYRDWYSMHIAQLSNRKILIKINRIKITKYTNQ